MSGAEHYERALTTMADQNKRLKRQVAALAKWRRAVERGRSYPSSVGLIRDWVYAHVDEILAIK